MARGEVPLYVAVYYNSNERSPDYHVQSMKAGGHVKGPTVDPITYRERGLQIFQHLQACEVYPQENCTAEGTLRFYPAVLH